MTRLRALVTGSLAAVVLTVAGGAAFGRTASADPGTGGCVGGHVSSVAHIAREELDVPPGQYLRGLPAANPGEVIQIVATFGCGKHQ